MSKQRYIQDSFWTDPYIDKLSPDSKLVFVYLLTNPMANIAGVYEIRSKRIAYETGYDVEVIENILKKFVLDGKIVRLNEWIVIVNHLKHQYLGSKTAEGVNRIINGAPKEIKDLFELKTFCNDKNEEAYEMYFPKEEIYPIQGVYKVPLSKVELSNVLDIYGEFKNVKLKEEEYQKLIEKIGERNTSLLIEELSTYIASKGKRYSNHYATLLNWARRKVVELNKLETKKRTIA